MQSKIHLLRETLLPEDRPQGKRSLCLPASNKPETLTRIGWREWLSLPELKITHIRAKIDTGAYTSSLHAYNISIFKDCYIEKVQFSLNIRSNRPVITCLADLIDVRYVIDSSGHKEQRCVISTTAILGPHQWPIEITLTSRAHMQFKMLLGRTALKGRFIVDSDRSYLLGKINLKNHEHSDSFPTS